MSSISISAPGIAAQRAEQASAASAEIRAQTATAADCVRLIMDAFRQSASAMTGQRPKSDVVTQVVNGKGYAMQLVEITEGANKGASAVRISSAAMSADGRSASGVARSSTVPLDKFPTYCQRYGLQNPFF
jgi:hypothetical protein